MQGLFLDLPPFAPDYSGVASALFELGGIVAIHDGTGCTGNYVCHDEPRFSGSNSAVFTSNLRELDTILGNDEVFLEKLANAASDLQANFIAILGSPAPMVIGTDYHAVARILEKNTGLPVLVFDTKGIDFYDKGQSDAFFTLAQRFVVETPQGREGAAEINIIGATPFDLGSERNLTDLKDLIRSCGFEKIKSWGMGGGFQDLPLTSAAQLNMVINQSGLAAARYLQDKYGTPYVVNLPIGQWAAMTLKDKLLRGMAQEKYETPAPKANGETIMKRALVIHEQVLGNSWRDCLQMDFGIPQVDVASFFRMDEDLLQPNDVHLVEEDDLFDLARKGAYDLIMGDFLFEELLADFTPHYLALSHLAVSSCLYRDDSIQFIGEFGSRFLRKKFLYR